MNQRNHFEKKEPVWLRALGSDDLPRVITIRGVEYSHVKTFKHDFFAATGLYAGDNEQKLVLKIGRQSPMWGLPLRWLGRALLRRESRMLKKMRHLTGIPKYLGEWSDTGHAHVFVEGAPLIKDDVVPEDFFIRLESLIADIHALNIALVDLEKRENILLGSDGRPWLFDFQISWDRSGWFFTRWILCILQRADRYHLLKHWRRARPEQLCEAQRRDSKEPPYWISCHRLIFRPLIWMRRHALVLLGARENAKGRSPG